MRHTFFILLFVSLKIFAYQEVEGYAIFNDNDYDEVMDFIKNNKTIKKVISPLSSEVLTSVSLKQLKDINTEIHKAYLEFFKLDEAHFPKPFVLISQGNNSTNVAYIKDQTIMPSNIIAIGMEHLANHELAYTTLAHEMAHYYHKHLLEKRLFKRVSYAYNRESINVHNQFGSHIPNDPTLNELLHQINYFDLMYYRGKADLEDLASIQITDSDPIYLLIKQRYSDLFQKDGQLTPHCKSLINGIKKLKKSTSPTRDMLAEIQKHEAGCELTENKSWDYLFYSLLDYRDLHKIVMNTEEYVDHSNPIIALAANAKINQTQPITTAIDMAIQQRRAFQEAIQNIDWDKVQFYTVESEADITGFKILNYLEKGHYQLSTLQLEPHKVSSCLEAIHDPKIRIPYLGEEKVYDFHGSLCFRAYRTIKMIEDMASYIKAVKIVDDDVTIN